MPVTAKVERWLCPLTAKDARGTWIESLRSRRCAFDAEIAHWTRLNDDGIVAKVAKRSRRTRLAPASFVRRVVHLPRPRIHRYLEKSANEGTIQTLNARQCGLRLCSLRPNRAWEGYWHPSSRAVVVVWTRHTTRTRDGVSIVCSYGNRTIVEVKNSRFPQSHRFVVLHNLVVLQRALPDS